MAYVPPHLRTGTKLTRPSAVLKPEEHTASTRPHSSRVLEMVLLCALFTTAIPVQAYNLWHAWSKVVTPSGMYA